MKLLCTGLNIQCDIDDVPRVTAYFIIPVHTSKTAELGDMVGKSVSLLAEGVDIVKKAPSDKQRCFHCAQLNSKDALECRKCGAPLEV